MAEDPMDEEAERKRAEAVRSSWDTPIDLDELQHLYPPEPQDPPDPDPDVTPVWELSLSDRLEHYRNPASQSRVFPRTNRHGLSESSRVHIFRFGDSRTIKRAKWNTCGAELKHTRVRFRDARCPICFPPDQPARSGSEA